MLLSGSEVKSELFPSDIIHYTLTPPSWAGSATGEILYRKDTINNIETSYDFRGVFFPRYSISANNRTTADGITTISTACGFITADDICAYIGSLLVPTLYEHENGNILSSLIFYNNK